MKPRGGRNKRRTGKGRKLTTTRSKKKGCVGHNKKRSIKRRAWSKKKKGGKGIVTWTNSKGLKTEGKSVSMEPGKNSMDMTHVLQTEIAEDWGVDHSGIRTIGTK